VLPSVKLQIFPASKTIRALSSPSRAIATAFLRKEFLLAAELYLVITIGPIIEIVNGRARVSDLCWFW
jgi:hypothetical protein